MEPAIYFNYFWWVCLSLILRDLLDLKKYEIQERKFQKQFQVMTTYSLLIYSFFEQYTSTIVKLKVYLIFYGPSVLYHNLGIVNAIF